MSVQLNHTIVHSRDKSESAEFLSNILGIGPPGTFGHFVTLEVSNGVSLDFADSVDVSPQHYAFLVGDAEFDAIFQRIRDARIAYFADPPHREEGQINTRHTGRGFYFSGPEGHNLEVFTRPYGTVG